MNLKKWVEKIIIYGSMTAFLNYFCLPISMNFACNYMKRHTKDPLIQKVCQVDSYLEDIANNIDVKNADALTFLKIAHAFTTKHLDYKATAFNEFNRALRGRADCTYFSNFTYSNFLYLADKFDRKDLKDKVKLVGGLVLDGDGEIDAGHAWLQIYHKDKWMNYETTTDILEPDDKLDFSNLDGLVSKYVLSDVDKYSYHFSHIHYDQGKSSSYFNPMASIESGIDFKDFLKFITKDFRNSLDDDIDYTP